jgi:3-hydroxyacyl-[acyl-carrier-protein] dehydratase
MSAILLDHFYHIDSLQKEEGTVKAQITFVVDHPIFKGHFPDMPIVPGVCQTQMLGEIFSQALGLELHLISAASIKFLSLVDPNKNPQLDLTISYSQTEEGNYNLSAQYLWNETVFFKFKGVYTDQ